ncbi:MAG: alpha/beta hydrolase [Candidatus Magasanikbacteria bacterium]|nr:alpha/beta hydrolase [Candidatus Magasanikbacteria bacterium]
MKKVIIIHGTCEKEEYYSDVYPSLSNSHWIPWLQKQLLIKGFYVQTPEIFEAFTPEYSAWKRELERFDIDEETILIGHSCGGGFLIRWLSENDVKIKSLILVAPWLNPEGGKTKDFFDFDIDENLIEKSSRIHLFVSSDDDNDILESVEIIKSKVNNIIFHKFSNQGHFTYNDMKTDKFPELFKTVVS